MDYWEECIRIAFEEEGIVATEEQIKNVSSAVEGGHENYGMAFGHDAIPNPVICESERKLKELQLKAEKRDQWERSTNPCKTCVTTGTVFDGWDRQVECPNCGGSGRVKHW